MSDADLASRSIKQDALGWKPAEPRQRNVSTALKAYAAFATSAAMGAIHKLPE